MLNWLDWRWALGAVALFALWLNTGLILAVALRQLLQLQRLIGMLQAGLTDGSFVQGVVTGTVNGVFAKRTVSQTGRAMTNGEPLRILFIDGSQVFELFDGALELPNGERLGFSVGDNDVEVWLDREALVDNVNSSDAEAFTAAHRQASKHRGFTREVCFPVEEGDTVWAWGRRESGTFIWIAERDGVGPLSTGVWNDKRFGCRALLGIFPRDSTSGDGLARQGSLSCRTAYWRALD